MTRPTKDYINITKYWIKFTQGGRVFSACSPKNSEVFFVLLTHPNECLPRYYLPESQIHTIRATVNTRFAPSRSLSGRQIVSRNSPNSKWLWLLAAIAAAIVATALLLHVTTNSVPGYQCRTVMDWCEETLPPDARECAAEKKNAREEFLSAKSSRRFGCGPPLFFLGSPPIRSLFPAFEKLGGGLETCGHGVSVCRKNVHCSWHFQLSQQCSREFQSIAPGNTQRKKNYPIRTFFPRPLPPYPSPTP